MDTSSVELVLKHIESSLDFIGLFYLREDKNSKFILDVYGRIIFDRSTCPARSILKARSVRFGPEGAAWRTRPRALASDITTQLQPVSEGTPPANIGGAS